MANQHRSKPDQPLDGRQVASITLQTVTGHEHVGEQTVGIQALQFGPFVGAGLEGVQCRLVPQSRTSLDAEDGVAYEAPRYSLDKSAW